MRTAGANAKFTHLAPAIRKAAVLSGPERIRLIRQERWIAYDRANAALAALEDLYDYPKRDRMPNMLLFGDTANGKTKIIRRFTALHQPYLNDTQEIRITPVVLIEMPPQPGLARLYSTLLEAVGAPFTKSARIETLEPLVLQVLRQLETRLIVIDEIHNLIACKALQQRQVLNQLKYLGNQLKIPLVGVGTEEAWSAIKSDPQMLNRFQPFHLPLWEEGDELLQLLMSFVRSLPLRQPSMLADEKIARQVLTQTDGTIGSITRLMEAAAIAAIESGTEQITLESLTVGEQWTRRA